MLRRLFRLLIIGIILAVIAYAASRLLGGDEDDYDDYDDLDSEFEFQETPVEIDVPSAETAPEPTQSPTSAASASASAQASTTPTPAKPPAVDTMSTVRLDDTETDTSTTESADSATNSGRLIDIVGIGPAYEARLHTIGISSIHDLAHADAEMIASQIEVIGGAATVGDWIEQARSHGSNGQS